MGRRGQIRPPDGLSSRQIAYSLPRALPDCLEYHSSAAHPTPPAKGTREPDAFCWDQKCCCLRAGVAAPVHRRQPRAKGSHPAAAIIASAWTKILVSTRYNMLRILHKQSESQSFQFPADTV